MHVHVTMLRVCEFVYHLYQTGLWFPPYIHTIHECVLCIRIWRMMMCKSMNALVHVRVLHAGADPGFQKRGVVK